MAIFKALTFDGVNSLDYGIYITGEAVYNAPERAVEMVNIPGKNGALALDQGRFENIEVTYHAGCFADSQADFADKVMKFRNALASRYTYKRLTDEYHPDEYRLGLYKSGLEVDAVRYSTAGEFNITFDCKPQRFLVDGDRAISPTEWSDIQTESGELVAIDSDGSLAVKSLEVSLSPIQDLNGYDKPWSGGAGKNKLYLAPQTLTDRDITWTVNADGTVTATGTLSSTNSAVYINATVPTGSYKFNGSGSGSSSSTYYAQVVDGSTWSNPGYGNRDVDVTIATTNVRIYFATKVSPPTSGITFKPMLRLSTETDATYEPYSNICPISGRTSVETTRTGKNRLPVTATTQTINGVTFTVNNDGTVTANGTATADAVFYLNKTTDPIEIPAGQYWLSGITGSTQGSWTTFMIGWGNYSLYYPAGRAVSLTGAYKSQAYIKVGNGYTVNNMVFKPMIELGSTKTSYEPYQGDTYTTSLGQTVYGGTLDVVSGVLTVDRAMADLGSFSWTRNTTEYSYPYFYTNGISGYTAGKLVCSCYKYASGGKASLTDGTISYYTATSTRIAVRNDSYTDATAFKTAMSGQTVVHMLATPQTYQLTPQQIDLLLGTNHLWSDGEITVEYGVHPYYNPTPFDAKPLIKVTGRGTLGIGEYILTITGTASQTLYIDCETMEIYTIEGTVPTGASSLVSINKNDFPVLEPGTNNISVGSGITAVTITPRWWRI